MQLPMPTFSPNGGGISIFDGIKISCSIENTSIYYTIDGSTPNVGNKTTMKYNPIAYARIYSPDDRKDHGIIKAIAVKSGYANSAVAISNDYVFYAATPWDKITEAITQLSSKDQFVTMTYSFMLPGTLFDNYDFNTGRPIVSSTLALSKFSPIFSVEQYTQTCIECLQIWKSFFENIFKSPKYKGKLTINFVPAPNSINGTERDNKIPSRTSVYYPIPNPSGVGDIRFGIGSLTTGIGAFTNIPLGPREGQIAAINGDVIINGNMLVRREDQPLTSGMINLKFVILHELGHALGGLVDDPYGLFGAKLMAYKLSSLSSKSNMQSPALYNLATLFPNGFNNDASWEKQRIEELHTIYKPIFPITPDPVILPASNSLPLNTPITVSAPSSSNPIAKDTILQAIDDGIFQQYTKPLSLTKNMKVDAVLMRSFGIFSNNTVSGQFACPIFSNLVTNEFKITTSITKPVINSSISYDATNQILVIKWTKDPLDTATVKYRIYYGINGLSTQKNNPTWQQIACFETNTTTMSLYNGITNTPYCFKIKTVDAQNKEDNEIVLNYTIIPPQETQTAIKTTPIVLGKTTNTTTKTINHDGKTIYITSPK